LGDSAFLFWGIWRNGSNRGFDLVACLVFVFGFCFGLTITAEFGFNVWSGFFGLVILLHDQVGIERELGSSSLFFAFEE
jgi:hypothetical protein